MTNENSMYTTQFSEHDSQSIHTLLPVDLEIGAPYKPLSRSFLVVDPRLQVCQRIPTQEEISSVAADRRKFTVGDYPEPYIADVLRAFRLLEGKRRYLEIGIFDRGNLSYVSKLMAGDAHLIGLDIQADPERDELLRANLKPGQKYDIVVGSSRLPASVKEVRSLLGGEKLDAIFIDGDHTAYGTMADYACYEEFVSADGVILFHDSAWEGNRIVKGTCDALAEIDRVDPVYLIDGDNPCRRFIRPLWRDELWGVVGVVFASDQKWRKSF